MPKDDTLSRGQVEEVAAGIRRLLAGVAAGQLTAGSGEVARFEGALSAMESLLCDSPSVTRRSDGSG